ncbi:DUF5818 domain-containing protein [Sphingomonas sp. CCH9-F2]|uniref:DUF5818 domain-containing protein n=1 Tax=Sphingomonas sp. CCH9-F2 TaxID=1768778 RepID=UPI0012E3F2EE|nr:DUF5818 domain-containing protein [Sphingomonas sp. CCH9-F2]
MLNAVGSDLVLRLQDGREWILLSTAGIERFIGQSVKVSGIRGGNGTLHVTGFAPAP